MSKLLWKPTTSQVNEANLASFFRFLNKRYSLHFNNDYQLLWEWSVNSRQDFWKILLEYLEIKCTKKDTVIISKENEIINQKFFENIEVNYAENILQSPRKNLNIKLVNSVIILGR
jgi:acetoacetyl-CoA synthetase